MIRVSSWLKDLVNLLSKLSFKRLLNYELNLHSFQLSALLKKQIQISQPVSLSVEPTSYCNLRCPHCPTGLKTLSRAQGYMVFNDFKKIIDETSTHLIYLMLYFQGEPFLNKHTLEMIKYAHSKRLYVMTSTNAQTIDESLAKGIVESGLDRIIISMDGVTEEAYTAYRTGGTLNKVTDAIKYLSRYKRELHSKTPFVEVQFLVLKSNEHQIEKAKELVNQLNADKLSFKTAQIYDIDANDALLPVNNKFSRYAKNKDGHYILKKKIKNSCYKMWSTAVITWDGQMVPCCYDKDGAFSFGNVKEDAIKKIWKSEAYNKFRNSILKNRKGIEMCRNCGE